MLPYLDATEESNPIWISIRLKTHLSNPNLTKLKISTPSPQPKFIPVPLPQYHPATDDGQRQGPQGAHIFEEPHDANAAQGARQADGTHQTELPGVHRRGQNHRHIIQTWDG